VQQSLTYLTAGLLPLLLQILAAFIVIDVFEFIKALASTLKGDPTPKSNGELTLNPFKHFEPIGFMLLIFMQFGWGQPVHTSNIYYKDKREGVFVTYISPMLASVLIAFVIKVLLGVFSGVFASSYVLYYIGIFLNYVRQYFLYLTVANLIPIHPMCGSKLIRLVLSPNTQMRYTQNEKLFQAIVIIALLLGVLQPIINAVVSALMRFV
jgi:Zn-dependent protease